MQLGIYPPNTKLHVSTSLQWCHNGHNSVSNHQPHDCLLNRLFRRRSKKTSKLRVTSLCEGNIAGTGEFPAQMTSNMENVSIWWRHHDKDAVLLVSEYPVHIFQRNCWLFIVRTGWTGLDTWSAGELMWSQKHERTWKKKEANIWGHFY